MSGNGPRLFQALIPILLCAAGFHGLFFYGNLARKTAAWAVFQSGLLWLMFQATSAAGPLPRVLALEAGAVALTVTLTLVALCVKMAKKHKSLEGGEIAKRISK